MQHRARKDCSGHRTPDRGELASRLVQALAAHPFPQWTAKQQIPDWGSSYRILAVTCDGIAEVLAVQPDLPPAAPAALHARLDRLLREWLLLALDRIELLRFLAHVPALTPTESRSEAETRPARRRRVEPPIKRPSAESRVDHLTSRIEKLHRSAAVEGGEQASVHEAHARILEQERELLRAWGKRDRIAAARMAALPDALAALLDLMRAGNVNVAALDRHLDAVGERSEASSYLGTCRASQPRSR